MPVSMMLAQAEPKPLGWAGGGAETGLSLSFAKVTHYIKLREPVHWLFRRRSVKDKRLACPFGPFSW